MEYTVSYKDQASLHIQDEIGSMAMELFKRISDGLDVAFKENRKFNIALSGGSTPVQLFEYLAGSQNNFENWENMNIFWGDERGVPPDHPESNYGNAWNSLLKHLNIPGENIFRIRGEDDPLKESARYAKELTKIRDYEGIPAFDLTLMGIGEDGHTASIFPGRMDLLESTSWVAETKHPETNQIRITLTGRILNNSENILFLVRGRSKRKVINHIFTDSIEARAYPAYHIRPRGRLEWLIDNDAAEDLG